MTESAPAKKSDLGVRFVSAVVMIAIAGGALWAGGWIFTAFVGLIAIGLLWEWWGLVSKIADKLGYRLVGLVLGGLYLALAISYILDSYSKVGYKFLLLLICVVIAVDVGAYFSGRALGGPKIAPSISPNKTWAGLLGGALAAFLVLLIYLYNNPFHIGGSLFHISTAIIGGGVLACTAQAGDFLESWMKRKAGVKDSGALIPGHGGLFDRLDGLIAVMFLVSLMSLYAEYVMDDIPEGVVEVAPE